MTIKLQNPSGVVSDATAGQILGIKAGMSLENVNNTSDANKPVSTAQAAALALKAALASPTFTGNPAAPTQAVGDNSTKLATTAYADVHAATAPVVVTAGFTFVKATHANRRIGYNSAGTANATFDGTAAFTMDDGFRLMQEGAGAITLVASGVTFLNPNSLSLTTTGPGAYIDAEWDATAGQLVITSTGAGGSFTGGTLTSALNEASPPTIASATTTDIGAAAGNTVFISGTTTITGLGTIAAGAVRKMIFQGALTFTHNATSLILPWAANITTAANDYAVMRSLGSGNWRCIGYGNENSQAIAVAYGGQSTPGIRGPGASGTGLNIAAATQVALTVNGINRLLCDSGTKSVGVMNLGDGLAVKEGSNGKQGLAVLVAGAVTVSCTNVTANSRILLTSNVDGGTPGWLRVSARTAATSFTITSSSGTDTSSVAYQIFEPA